MLVEQNNHNQWYYKVVYFFVVNQVVFKRLAIILLILVNIIIWWLSGVKLVNYWNDGLNYKNIVNQLVATEINWSDYHLENRPLELEVISVNKVKTDNNKYVIFEALAKEGDKGLTLSKREYITHRPNEFIYYIAIH